MKREKKAEYKTIKLRVKAMSGAVLHWCLVSYAKKTIQQKKINLVNSLLVA
jgi:hypothetical protein